MLDSDGDLGKMKETFQNCQRLNFIMNKSGKGAVNEKVANRIINKYRGEGLWRWFPGVFKIKESSLTTQPSSAFAVVTFL